MPSFHQFTTFEFWLAKKFVLGQKSPLRSRYPCYNKLKSPEQSKAKIVMRLDYHLLDVFTEQQFGGNQLAVFPEPPPDLPVELMQQIAKELNLSETVFVFPPDAPSNHFRLRIFTPAAELPIAGHPTVGAAWALAHLGRIGELRERTSIVFEKGVGPIPVTIENRPAGRASGGVDAAAKTAIP